MESLHSANVSRISRELQQTNKKNTVFVCLFCSYRPIALGKDTESGTGGLPPSFVLVLEGSLVGRLVVCFERSSRGFPTRKLEEFDRHV